MRHFFRDSIARLFGAALLSVCIAAARPGLGLAAEDAPDRSDQSVRLKSLFEEYFRSVGTDLLKDTRLIELNIEGDVLRVLGYREHDEDSDSPQNDVPYPVGPGILRAQLQKRSFDICQQSAADARGCLVDSSPQSDARKLQIPLNLVWNLADKAFSEAKESIASKKSASAAVIHLAASADSFAGRKL